MSLKKGKFTISDVKFMKFAINLAKNNKGLTGTNPSVGCVVTKNNNIISYGSTDIKGRPHAEVIALRKKGLNTKGATVYLTLEPCTHFGKTPPCTNQLIKSNIKKVIYSIEDIDERTFNKAKKILKKKKITINSGLLKNEVKKLYRSYNFVKKKEMPYIIGKLACSSNFFIFNNSNFITNEESRKVSHLLRYQNQGILTTYKTINKDNSKLTCRLNGLEKFSPKRLILDKNLKIKINSFVVKNSLKNKTIIFHKSNNKKKIKLLKKSGLKLIYFNKTLNNNLNLSEILKKIYSMGIHTLLVEAGRTLIYDMLLKNLFNEFYLFQGQIIIKSKKRVNVIDIVRKLNKNFNKSLVETYLDKDKLIHYY